MKIELRKISYNASLSEETNAFTAQLFVDGLHIANVSNHGTGGPDNCQPVNGKTHADIKAVDQWCENNLPKKEIPNCGVFEQLEMVCAELLAEYLIARDLQRTLKRTIAYYDPVKNAVLVFKGKIEGPNRAHIIVDLARKNPRATVLNNLPFDQALALYSAVA